ncbi:MAG: DUF2889 domain-containing protein [Desulfatitalea sp.]|nr:DUF2889 domain-containing protein [Desulfatitalea sp.]NNJ98889.1 DUF2889 domain-containing protein [Desulfatitalea sp.]
MLFDPEACKPIHNRNISVTTYDFNAAAIALEGRLADDWLVDSYDLFGKRRSPNIVHGMVVRMIVRIPELVVEAVEAEMNTVPYPECPQAIDSLMPLIGERISAGFTAKVQQLVGGAQGCAHLLALCRAMGSAAIQGAFAMLSQQPPEAHDITKDSLKRVIDTCHLWRADGPMVQQLKSRYCHKDESDCAAVSKTRGRPSGRP